MRQFINGNTSAFARLEQRIRPTCVVFPDMEMPPPCDPTRARVGFDYDAADGSFLLLVDRGVSYCGPEESVRAWLEDGVKRFATFADLVRWMQTDLARCYA